MVVGKPPAIQPDDLPFRLSERNSIPHSGSLAAMEKSLRSEINAKWMDAGVTLEDPDTAYIGPEVTIGRDTVIGPNVHLRGRTVIGEGCRFDGTALLTDAVLGDDVHVKLGVVVTGVAVASGSRIGPFVELGPGVPATKRA